MRHKDVPGTGAELMAYVDELRRQEGCWVVVHIPEFRGGIWTADVTQKKQWRGYAEGNGPRSCIHEIERLLVEE